MHIYARQGDLVIDKLAKPLTGELEPARDIVFAGDSSGHPHRLLGACRMRRDGRRFLVQLATDTVLEHGKPDGHKTVAMPAGDYEIRPLRERGVAGDRPVED